MRKTRLFCFNSVRLNDLEIDLDPNDPINNEIIAEESFGNEKEKGKKINFDILEKIQRIYYSDNIEVEMEES